jgi:hypothetical protein
VLSDYFVFNFFCLPSSIEFPVGRYTSVTNLSGGMVDVISGCEVSRSTQACPVVRYILQRGEEVLWAADRIRGGREGGGELRSADWIPEIVIQRASFHDAANCAYFYLYSFFVFFLLFLFNRRLHTWFGKLIEKIMIWDTFGWIRISLMKLCFYLLLKGSDLIYFILYIEVWLVIIHLIFFHGNFAPFYPLGFPTFILIYIEIYLKRAVL